MSKTCSEATVAAIVPIYNRWEKTQRFIQHFAQQQYSNLTIVVVDANSPDGSAAKIRAAYPNVVLLETNSQQYWAGGTNKGVQYALNYGYDYILTINDDAVAAPNHVQHLVTLARTHQISILGNRIDYLNVPGKVWGLGTQLVWGTPNFLRLQYAGMMAKDLPAEVLNEKVMVVDALPGDGVLIHRRVFEQVGLYRAKFLPHYHADSEFILRAGRAGFQAYVAPHVVLQDDFSAEQKRLDLKSVAGLRYALFNPKSHLYLMAIAYIFFRYCPWWAYPKTIYYLFWRLLCLRKSGFGPKGDGR